MMENFEKGFKELPPSNLEGRIAPTTEYTERSGGINVKKYQASSNLKVIVMLVVVMVGLLGVVGYFGYQKYIASKGGSLSEDMKVLSSSNPSQIADYFYKKATGKSEVDTSDVVKQDANVKPVSNVEQSEGIQKTTTMDVDLSGPSEDEEIQNAKKVAVSVGGGGRLDPFMPYTEKNLTMFNPDFDIVAPPEQLSVNPAVQEMMKATVSGIMYQKGGASSAIVNINGSDQLVRVGDKVDGQSIIDITRDRVVMKQGSNIFRVAVGQSIESTGITYNNVSNLNKKFGGASAPRRAGVIEINVSNPGGAPQPKSETIPTAGNVPSGMPQIPTL